MEVTKIGYLAPPPKHITEGKRIWNERIMPMHLQWTTRICQRVFSYLRTISEALSSCLWGGIRWHISHIQNQKREVSRRSMSNDNGIRRVVLTCASRGRNPSEPSDRRKGIYLEQRIEIGGGIANCLTNVAKDSYVMIISL